MSDPKDSKHATRYPAAALLLLTCAFFVIRTGRDALYFQEDGLFALPKALILIATLSIPQAMLVLRLLARFGRRVTRLAYMSAVLCLIVAFYPFATPGAGLLSTGFFVFVPLVFAIMFSTTWLLGAENLEVFPKAEQALGFSKLGAASIVGGVLGGGVARLLGPIVGPRNLLLVGAFLLLVTLAIIVVTHRKFPVLPPKRTVDKDHPELDATPGRWYVLLLLLVAMAAALSAVFIDFQFYLHAFRSRASGAENTIFFANVYLILNVFSLALQLYVSPKLQRFVGVSGSLLLLPASVFFGAASLLFSVTAFSRVGIRVVEGGLKSGVHRSIWEQVFLAFPKENRSVIKVLVDGLGARIAEGIAAGCLFLWIRYELAKGGKEALYTASTTWVTIGIVIATTLWLLLSAWLGRSIRRRELSSDPIPSWQTPLPDF